MTDETQVAGPSGLDGYNELSPEQKALVDQHQMNVGGQVLQGINQLMLHANDASCKLHEAYVQTTLTTADGRIWSIAISGFNPDAIQTAGTA